MGDRHYSPWSREYLGPASPLQQNRRAIYSAYQPAFPSPLSQRPLQASVSSSFTAASAATSARTSSSTRTTSTSATSKFSITQAFSALSHDDIDFFDQVISLLPPDAQDFGQLKKAYNVVLASELDNRARHGRNLGTVLVNDDDEDDWDTNLWSCMLSLVKVRGKDWQQRWDSVRIALGLEPRSSSYEDEDSSERSDSQAEESTASSSHFNKNVGAGGGSSSAYNLWHPSRDERMSQLADTPGSACTSSTLNQYRHRSRDFTSALSRPSFSHDSWSKENMTHSHGHESSMDETSDEPVAGPSRLPNLHERNVRATHDRWRAARLGLHPSGKHHSSDSDAQVPPRRSASKEIQHMGKAREHRAGDTTLDPLDKNGSRLRRLNLDASQTPQQESTRCDAALPPSIQKRFQEVVRSSQAEREAIRKAKLAQQDEEEERKWSEAATAADALASGRLLRKGLSRWLDVYARQRDRETNVFEARNRVILARSWDRWLAGARRERDARVRALKIDDVRCKLSAWRRWRRLLRTKAQKEEDQKKEALRSAYYHISGKVKKRLVKQAYITWRDLYLEHVADAVRRHHLQQGALALWQIRLARSQTLHIQESELFHRYRFRLLDTAFTRWTKQTQLRSIETRVTRRADRHLAQDAFATWSRAFALSKLSSAFAKRRLTRAAFYGWIEAMSVRADIRRKEALADRWKNRRSKRSALQTWLTKFGAIVKLQDRASDFFSEGDQWRLKRTFSLWVARERGALLRRVNEGRVLERAFHHWRDLHRSLTTSLTQRESTMVVATSHGLLRRTLNHWKGRARERTDKQITAMKLDRSNMVSKFFKTWERKLETISLNESRAGAISDYFSVRTALQSWQSKLRESRVSSALARRNKAVLGRSLAMWRVRLDERLREEKAVASIHAKRNLRVQGQTLRHWMQRVIERRNLELEVTEQRQRRVFRAAFYAWVEACLRHDDMLNLMQSYLDVKQEEVQRRTFLHWLAAARAQRHRRERAEKFLRDKRSRVLASAWEKWYDHYADAVLRPVEYEAMLRRQALVKAQVLSKWQARTRSLPAIQFRNQQLRLTTIAKWKQALPRALAARKAVEVDRRTVLSGMLAKWISGAKTRQQMRAAARFGGPSMVRLKTLSTRHGTPTPRSFVARARRLSSPGQVPTSPSPVDALTPTQTRVERHVAESSVTGSNFTSLLFSSPRKERAMSLAQLAPDSALGLSENSPQHSVRSPSRGTNTDEGAASVSSLPIGVRTRLVQHDRAARSDAHVDESPRQKRSSDMALAAEMLAALRTRRRQKEL